jgi:putative ABC transport system substrate-binding protein
VLASAGAAALAWPLAARAQSAKLPVVGFLTTRSRASAENLLAAFQAGLAQAGYTDGRDVAVEYRWADDRLDRLPELVADLIGRNAAVIVTGGTAATVAALAATKTIPVVFSTGGDPVRFGFVKSLSRPGGNATGVAFYQSVLLAKQIELLNNLVPKARNLGILVQPKSPVTEPALNDARAAVQSLGKPLKVLPAESVDDLEPSFRGCAQAEIDGLVFVADPFFDSRPAAIAALAARYAIPTVYYAREFAAAGDLMSYGADTAEAYRLAGVYAGQIVKGASPSELPVVQPTKFQLVINRKAAGALGLAIPPALLVGADEVIE